MYTVRQAAGLVGIPAATLRAWEQRYRVVSPRRAPNGYRMYDEADVARLRRMAALVEQGVPAGQAADTVLQHGARAGGAAVPTDPEGDELVRLAGTMDQAGLRRLLRERLLDDPEAAITGWLLPGLHRLGRSWQDGTLGIAHEHLVSRLVVQALDRMIAETPVGGDDADEAPLALLGLTSGDQHQIALLCFHLVLRRRGVAVADLGTDVPLADWATAVEQLQPRVLVTSATRAVDARRADLLATRLAPHQLWVGGAASHRCSRALPLPPDVVRAADRVATELRAGVAL